jgi:peptidoglycan hydrolase-like protein with peptidoglycan-binding domain
MLQAALITLKYKMPISTARDGKPDGIYGNETESVVRNFQSANNLMVDGFAGHQTVTRLDALLPKPNPSPPARLTIRGTDSSDNFKIGTDDPKTRSDPGAGPWNSKPKTLTMDVKKILIVQLCLPSANGLIGQNATENMYHYFANDGTPFEIDLKRMVRESPNAKEKFELDIAEVKAFVETLQPGTFDITSKEVTGGYNHQNKSTDWFFAVGGYVTWTKGRATINQSPTGRTNNLDLEYKFFDRYNWDTGKHVEINGIEITDAFMGEFHREGLAREFDMFGSLRTTFNWSSS